MRFSNSACAALLSILVAASCATTTDEPGVVHDDPAASVSAFGPMTDGERSGTWTVRHANGTTAARGDYQNGKRTGAWTWWDDTGQKRGEGHYRRGERHGRWQTWEADGTLESDVTWRRGQRESIAKAHNRPKRSRPPSCNLQEAAFRVSAIRATIDACATTTTRLTARWMVASDGQIDDVRIEGADTAARACVESAIWTMMFSQPVRGRCRVDMALSLQP